MRLAECNVRQKKAYMNIYHAANWIIGGLVNTMEDNEKDSEEYKSAEAQLNDHDGLAEMLYNAATTEIYTDGSVMWGGSAERYLKDIRFCGKEWLMERVHARLRKNGY